MIDFVNLPIQFIKRKVENVSLCASQNCKTGHEFLNKKIFRSRDIAIFPKSIEDHRSYVTSIVEISSKFTPQKMHQSQVKLFN